MGDSEGPVDIHAAGLDQADHLEQRTVTPLLGSAGGQGHPIADAHAQDLAETGAEDDLATVQLVWVRVVVQEKPGRDAVVR